MGGSTDLIVSSSSHERYHVRNTSQKMTHKKYHKTIHEILYSSYAENILTECNEYQRSVVRSIV